ncbi:Transcription activator of gluconeogenesis ERT1 [Fusarium acutatum]|uniref:Transcription activator of gluconeogenesis ERT1 n=1 Tax=Fusarium acutatum TaxID=78861 RepID=A0A8H4NHF3_9HYPO|nr:Transcription activator of gluconeogenesis ERT1 [Fusarium acutatum]
MVIKGSVSDSASVPLGQRRGISDLAQIALDLAWVSESAEQDSFARYRAYPSPPMSGSPPLPSKQPQDAGDRGQAPVGYSASSQPDTYWSNSNQQLPTDRRGPANMQTTLPRLFQPGPPDAPPFSYRRTEETVPRPVSYIQPGGPSMPQSSGYIPPGIPGAPSSYTSSVRPGKRKVMWPPHVSLVNERIFAVMEESCVDVQHKKRGRPRLRDDRETRYDPSRFPHPQDATARRPLSIYPSGVPIGPGEHMNPRYPERGPNMDAPTFPPPLSAGPRGADPVAFLNMKLDFAKASPTFMEALGHVELQGQNLGDVVVPAEREKVASIRSQLIEEQTRKEPNYLPPILSRLDHIIQGLGFSAEDIGRFRLDRNEYLTFRATDGQPRHYPVRLGLEKEGSIYVVVMVLSLPPRHAYPLPSSPATREASHAYGSQPPTPQSLYRTPVPPGPPFDMPRGRFSEVPLVSRPAAVPPTQLPAAINPGVAAGAGSISYAASPSHTEYGGPPSYNVPRSELPPASVYRPQAAFQLPPIRAQPGPEQPRPRTREERPNRVDIGGLIDKPDDPERRR